MKKDKYEIAKDAIQTEVCDGCEGNCEECGCSYKTALDVLEKQVSNMAKTNYDRILEMSKEQMAEFLLKVNCSHGAPCMIGTKVCKWEDYPTHDKGCKDCFLEWLQDEIKDGNHGKKKES